MLCCLCIDDFRLDRPKELGWSPELWVTVSTWTSWRQSKPTPYVETSNWRRIYSKDPILRITLYLVGASGPSSRSDGISQYIAIDISDINMAVSSMMRKCDKCCVCYRLIWCKSRCEVELLCPRSCEALNWFLISPYNVNHGRAIVDSLSKVASRACSMQRIWLYHHRED